MSIIYTLDRSTFVNLFGEYGRGTDFTHTAREALYDYYDSLSEDTGTPFEMDVIAICCDWSECDTDTLLRDYGYMIDLSEYDDQGDQAQALIQELNGHTTVLEVDNGNYLVGAF